MSTKHLFFSSLVNRLRQRALQYRPITAGRIRGYESFFHRAISVEQRAAAFFKALNHFICALFCYVKAAANALKAHAIDCASVYHFFVKAYVKVSQLFAALGANGAHLSTSLPM